MSIEDKLKDVGLSQLYKDAICFNKVTDGGNPLLVESMTICEDETCDDFVGIYVKDNIKGGFYISLDKKSLFKAIDEAKVLTNK